MARGRYCCLPFLHELFSAHGVMKRPCLQVETQTGTVSMFKNTYWTKLMSRDSQYHVSWHQWSSKFKRRQNGQYFMRFCWQCVCVLLVHQLPFISFNLVKRRSKFSTSASPAVRLANSWISKSIIGSERKEIQLTYYYLLYVVIPAVMKMSML